MKITQLVKCLPFKLEQPEFCPWNWHESKQASKSEPSIADSKTPILEGRDKQIPGACQPVSPVLSEFQISKDMSRLKTTTTTNGLAKTSSVGWGTCHHT